MGGFRPPLQSDPGGSLAVHFSGLSLSFHFGRGAYHAVCRHDSELNGIASVSLSSGVYDEEEI